MRVLEKAAMDQFVFRYLNISGQAKDVISDDNNNYIFFEIPKSGLVPSGDYLQGNIYFDDWAKYQKRD
ncbi:hypothetical protein SAMN05443633_108155 [Chryseobacterium arachidis]|uniref:Uncharacterized protein n=1 Tax=Chryseobacterium arachidis TaxID=1416778 RepID=A0A1M5FVN0_9FLAO|nr:hypothetical protein SAMN05443633_108155 [Chryseobacterium arachidis]